MPIAAVGQSISIEDSAAAESIIAVPAGVASGHTMLMALGTTTVGPITFPDGWTQLETEFAEGGARYVLGYRIAGGNEPPTYAWDLGGFGASVGMIGAYSGTHATSPIADTALASTTVDTTTQAIAQVSVPPGGWLVYLPIDRRNNSTDTQSWSTSDASDVRRIQDSGNDGSGSQFSGAIFDSNRDVEGTPSRTVTAAFTWAQMAVWSVALAPAEPMGEAPPPLVRSQLRHMLIR